MVEGHEAQKEHDHRNDEAVRPHLQVAAPFSKKRISEHFYDGCDGIELKKHFPSHGYARYGIDDRGRVHEEGKAEADQVAQVVVLGCQRGNHDAEPGSEERQLENVNRRGEYPPRERKLNAVREVIHVEDEHDGELDEERKERIGHIGYRHGQSGKIDLAEQARIVDEGVRTLLERCRKKGPQHRSRKVEQCLGYFVGAHLRDVSKHEHVQERRHKRLEHEPQRAENRLFIDRNKLASDHQRDKIFVLSQLFKVQPQPHPFRCYDDVPCFLIRCHYRRFPAFNDKNSRYERSMPSLRPIFGFQPSAKMRELSRSFRGVPLGFVVSHRISPRNPSTSAISSASSLMLSSCPEPTFMNSPISL